MEQQNNEQVKSYVQEFLESAKTDHVYYRSSGAQIILREDHGWFSRFCNELELLLERSKLLDEITSDMKQRYETEKS